MQLHPEKQVTDVVDLDVNLLLKVPSFALCKQPQRRWGPLTPTVLLMGETRLKEAGGSPAVCRPAHNCSPCVQRDSSRRCTNLNPRRASSSFNDALRPPGSPPRPPPPGGRRNLILLLICNLRRRTFVAVRCTRERWWTRAVTPLRVHM